MKLVFAIRRRADVAPDEFHRYWLEEFVSASGSQEGRRAGAILRVDEARFIDFERSSLFVAEEHEIFEAPGG